MFDKLKKRWSGERRVATPAAETVSPPPIVDVTDEDFETRVLQAEMPAVVDFWAEWCQPCQVMSAYVGFLARDYAGRVLVAALDTDENPETPTRFQVMGLPTLLLLCNGEEVDRIVGVTSYEAIKERVAKLLPNT